MLLQAPVHLNHLHVSSNKTLGRTPLLDFTHSRRIRDRD
jgi:hypothetical protein